MLHLGDITKIDGTAVPMTDVVIGGSPCQNLSFAGKREGLAGEQSGLFIEQIRIIKEMRENDRKAGRRGVDIRPRYMVWENVPGAFSSNGGEDFRTVLEEIAKISKESISIPRPEGGKWTNAGCIIGNDFSIAYRILDSQFWGVPQRRRRIALVADFGGQSAPEILFVRKSTYGYQEQGGEERQTASSDVTRSNRSGDLKSCNWDGGGIAPTLTANNAGGQQRVPDKENFNCVLQPVVYNGATVTSPANYQSQEQGDACPTISTDTRNLLVEPVYAGKLGYIARFGNKLEEDKTPCLETSLGDNSMSFVQAVYDARGYGNGNTAPTITGDHENRITDYTGVVVQSQPLGLALQSSMGIGAVANDISPALVNGDNPGWQNGVCHEVKAVDLTNLTESTTNGCLQAMMSNNTHSNNVVRLNYILRRLTPLEVERLQGYPDGWTDIGEYVNTKGKRCQTSDTVRYKALGNSIALPPWKWVLKRLSACYERPATMASLFDGIGGFPLIWEQFNGKGSCLWASEIEEFPIAVTKERIG